jgi:hypothetical protein
MQGQLPRRLSTMRLNVKQAREKVEALRLALVSPSPEEMAAALPGLEEAALCLATVERELREGAPASFEVHRELKLLKNDLRISARLIEQGIAFCRGWAKLLGAGQLYTYAGQAAPSPTEGTFSVQG